MISLSENSSTSMSGSDESPLAIMASMESHPSNLPGPADMRRFTLPSLVFISFTTGSKRSSKIIPTASQLSKMYSASGGARRKLTGTATAPVLAIP